MPPEKETPPAQTAQQSPFPCPLACPGCPGPGTGRHWHPLTPTVWVCSGRALRVPMLRALRLLSCSPVQPQQSPAVGPPTTLLVLAVGGLSSPGLPSALELTPKESLSQQPNPWRPKGLQHIPAPAALGRFQPEALWARWTPWRTEELPAASGLWQNAGIASLLGPHRRTSRACRSTARGWQPSHGLCLAAQQAPRRCSAHCCSEHGVGSAPMCIVTAGRSKPQPAPVTRVGGRSETRSMVGGGRDL